MDGAPPGFAGRDLLGSHCFQTVGTANPRPNRYLHPKSDFLTRFPRPVRADADGDRLIEPLKELQQLVGGEPAEMPVHQMRDFRLLEGKQEAISRCLSFRAKSSLWT